MDDENDVRILVKVLAKIDFHIHYDKVWCNKLKLCCKYIEM